MDTAQMPTTMPLTNANRFSVFFALLNYAELTLEIAKNLDVDDLVSLYAISRDFHRLVNTRFTAMITAQWQIKAYESGCTFIHRCYKNLCMQDPARRVNETTPSEIRFIPSFRWLRMVLFREEVVDGILQCLRNEGHRVPKPTSLAIKKIWFTLDVGDNFRRIGLLHNTRFWTNQDLGFATMFFLKLDMYLTDPSSGNGETGLRKMLLNQRSLSTLWRVLRREEMRTQLDMLRMIVRYDYEPLVRRDMNIMGIPPSEVGKLQYEGWGAKDTKFIRIEELIMREAIRRRLNLHLNYVDMMIWGYIDKRTHQDVRTEMQTSSQETYFKDDESEDEQSSGGKQTFQAEDSNDEGGENDDEEDVSENANSNDEADEDDNKGEGSENANSYDEVYEDGGEEGSSESPKSNARPLSSKAKGRQPSRV